MQGFPLTSENVNDPVVKALVLHAKGMASNPAMHIFSTCYGVVNLNLHNFSVTPPPLSAADENNTPWRHAKTPPQGMWGVGGWV